MHGHTTTVMRGTSNPPPLRVLRNCSPDTPITSPNRGITPPPDEDGAVDKTNSCISGQGKDLAPSCTFVKSILHLPNEDDRPLVHLVLIDEDSGEEMIQTSLHTNAVPLRSNRKGYTVLAVACGR